MSKESINYPLSARLWNFLSSVLLYSGTCTTKPVDSVAGFVRDVADAPLISLAFGMIYPRLSSIGGVLTITVVILTLTMSARIIVFKAPDKICSC